MDNPSFNHNYSPSVSLDPLEYIKKSLLHVRRVSFNSISKWSQVCYLQYTVMT